MFTSRTPWFQSQRRSRDDEDYVVGGLCQALIGEALQITARASYWALRHEAAAERLLQLRAPPRTRVNIIIPWHFA
jgi:hypothetical protein